MTLNPTEMQALQKKLDFYFSNFDFPSEESYMEFLDNAISVLENESTDYRPLNSIDNAGGLLDFISYEKPVIVVPDLHGRNYFLKELLEFDISEKIALSESKTVLEALSEGLLKIICVGDGMHGESRAYARWIYAWQEFQLGISTGPAMQEEMKENISTMMAVMELKKCFPEDFHFLKGNHENVLNENKDGNYAFMKFAYEGQMVRSFFEQYYGDAVLHLISLWEKTLPLCAVFNNFAISHAEPLEEYRRSEIINSSLLPKVIDGLTWTSNDSAMTDSAYLTFINLNPAGKFENFYFIGGHRPVEGKYLLRQGGSFIQIHNPSEENVALCFPGKKINPDKDIFSVKKGDR